MSINQELFFLTSKKVVSLHEAHQTNTGNTRNHS